MAKHYLTSEQCVHAIDLYQAGDNTALSEVACLIGQGIYHYLRHHGFDAEQEDVVQEAVLAILEQADKIQTVGNPFSYMTTIVLNKMRGHAKSRKTYRNMLDTYFLESCKHEK